MLHRGSEKGRATDIRCWKLGRGGLPRGGGQAVVGRSFEEDLALFERQVREEAGERAGRLAGPGSSATLSA